MTSTTCTCSKKLRRLALSKRRKPSQRRRFRHHRRCQQVCRLPAKHNNALTNVGGTAYYLLLIRYSTYMSSNADAVTNAPIYTPWAIKTCHFIFHYNSRISWPIFTLFIPMETGQNTVQYSHLKD